MHGQHQEDNRTQWHMLFEPSELARVVVVATEAEAYSASTNYFSKAGRKIGVGDCALFKAGSAPPFIGIIRKVLSEKEGDLKLCVNWLYRFGDVKLAKGAPLEAAPNEIFYSFHKDEISAASLLHPCKVAFLQKGVDLPSGVSSFVCRRVYDIPNKCLYWLTDRDYTDERQAEVDELLDKTKHVMQATTQSEGPCQRATTPTSSKSQGVNVNLTGQGKSKKRTRPEHNTDSSRRERPMKVEEGESKGECVMKFEDFASIADKDGGITNTSFVEQLLQVMLQERNDSVIKTADSVSRRTLLAGIIAATEQEDCLTHFVQLGGLPVLDDWLQEAHKGKLGDGSPKEGDKGLEELLLTLLRALDKLPVDLGALKTYMVGKSVNNLRSHRNSEIQKKARKLVDTWKKRVDAEMKSSDEGKSGQNTGAALSSKSASESHNTKGRSAGSSKSNSGKPSGNGSAPSSDVKGNHKEHSGSKDASGKSHVSVTSEVLAPVKEEKSCGSSQSQNNSQSWCSGQAKGSGSWREEVKAPSVASAKTPGTLRSHSHSSKSCPTSSSTGFQKDQTGKHKTLGCDKGAGVENSNSQRLIVRFPNPGRSPSHSVSGGSLVDGSASNHRTSSPASTDRQDPMQDNCKPPIVHSPDASGDTKFGNCSANGLKSTADCSKDNSGRSCTADEVDCKSSGVEHTPKDLSVSKDLDTSIGKDIPASADTPVSSAVSPDSIRLESVEGGIDLLASIAAREGSEAEKSCTGSSSGEGIRLSSEANGDCSKHDKISNEPVSNTKEGQSDKQKQDVPAKASSVEAASGEWDTAIVEEAVQLVGLCKESTAKKQVEERAVSDSLGAVSADNVSGKEGNTSLALVSHASTVFQDGSCVTNLLMREPTHVDEEKISILTRNISSESGKGQVLSGSGFGSAACPVEDSLNLEGASSPTSDVRVLLTHKNSAENLSGYYEEDALEVARQVAKEVEQEVEAYDPQDVNTLSPSKNDVISESPLDNTNVNDECAMKDAVKGRPSSPTSGVIEDLQRGKEETDAVPNLSAMEVETEKPTRSKDRIIPNTDILPESSVTIAEESTMLDEQRTVIKASVMSIAAPVAPVTEPSLSDEKATKLESKEIERPVFDLNEGFIPDDGPNDLVQSVPDSAIADSLAAQPNSVAAPIAVVAATKGAFIPPSTPSTSKVEWGWKGSAATSAFRPAEPRRVSDSLQLSVDGSATSDAGENSKRARFLDIDLNVADEGATEDSSMASKLAIGQLYVDTFNQNNGIPASRPELDLNRVDECDENAGSVVPTAPPKINKGVQPRGVLDFDLNDGLGLEETAAEEVSSQHKNIGISNPVVAGILTNPEIVNTAAWYSAPASVRTTMVIPTYSSNRSEPPYPVVAGSSGKSVITMGHNVAPFTGDVYRGGAACSSNDVSYSTTMPAAFSYPGFSFGAGFPFSSASYNVTSSPLLSSTTSPPFLTAPSPLVTAGTVTSSYGRPYIMSGIRDPTGADTNSAWLRPNLDLNAGPDGAPELDVRDEVHGSRLSSGLTHMSYQQSLPTGAPLKRKEPETGFDPLRSGFKQMTWR